MLLPAGMLFSREHLGLFSSEIIWHLALGIWHTDWTPFDKEVAIPDWAARYNVQLLVEGKGRAWLDEVSLTRVNRAAASKAKPLIVWHP